MHAAGAPHHLSLKVILKCLVFWVEHCLKQTFRRGLRRKMWTILPRAVSGVRKKTAVWSKQSVRTIYNSEQYILAWLSGCGPFKICLTWCDLFKCPQSNFKSRCKSKVRKQQTSGTTNDQSHAGLGLNATLFRPGAPPLEEAKGGLHSSSVLMDCIVCWSHIDHDPHGLMDLRRSSKKWVYWKFSTHLYLPLCFSKAYTTQSQTACPIKLYQPWWK